MKAQYCCCLTTWRRIPVFGYFLAPVYRQNWQTLPRFGYQLMKTAINKSLFFSSKDNNLTQSVLLA